MSNRTLQHQAFPAEVQKLFEEARSLSESAPRKHHLVPSSYLRRWEEGGQIRVTEVSNRRDYVTSSSKAARETDFYLVASEDMDPHEMPPLLFEVLLGHVEQWGKEAIDQLLTADLIDLEVLAHFAWFLALQFTRGASFRREERRMANEFYKLQYGGLSDDGIREMFKGSGVVPTDELVASSRSFLDQLLDGSIFVSPQDAALVGLAGQSAENIGEHFFTRSWVVFETTSVMITCDEPVVFIGGPPLPRYERAGALTAGVVVFPLDPAHVLVLFRDDVARRLGLCRPLGQIARGALDHIETVDLCREVAMNADRWTFERPSKKLAAKFHIPPMPEPFSIQDVGTIDHGDRQGQLVLKQALGVGRGRRIRIFGAAALCCGVGD